MIVFRVVSNGVDVHFTQDKKSAESAFKDSKDADLWQVEGKSVILLNRKSSHLFKLSDLARYGH